MLVTSEGKRICDFCAQPVGDGSDANSVNHIECETLLRDSPCYGGGARLLFLQNMKENEAVLECEICKQPKTYNDSIHHDCIRTIAGQHDERDRKESALSFKGDTERLAVWERQLRARFGNEKYDSMLSRGISDARVSAKLARDGRLLEIALKAANEATHVRPDDYEFAASLYSVSELRRLSETIGKLNPTRDEWNAAIVRKQQSSRRSS